jgi:hypothetical protein
MPDDIKQFILERIQVEDSSLVVEMIMDSEELDRLCNGRYIVNKDRLARMISRKEKANDIFQMCFKNTPI